jgi:hypothetical protein
MKMRNHVLGALALSVAVAASSVAFAADRGPSFEEREKAQQSAFQHSVTYGYPAASQSRAAGSSVHVVYLNELPKGAGTRIKSAATAQSKQSVQASIDAATASELRARGVQVNNVIAIDKAFDGSTIYYVR